MSVPSVFSRRFFSLMADNRIYPKTSFRSQDVVIERIPAFELRQPDWSKSYKFGHEFTNYMMEIDWNSETGWSTPTIRKTQPILIHPAVKGLHYGVQIFEGMKAFRGIDNKIRLFRPELNMVRMNISATRAVLPNFDAEQLIQLITTQISLDHDWIPSKEGSSLYVRPFMIGTDGSLGVSPSRYAKLMVLCSPAAGYFEKTDGGLKLLADPGFVRAWPGGAGAFKMGSNYAPTVLVAEAAAAKGCDQVLWLSGDAEWVTEAGTMNFGMFWTNEDGEKELITASLEQGLVLSGITRNSILELTKSWGEFKVSEKDFTMEQMIRGIQEKRVHELFGCGTAAVVAPVSSILYVKKGNETCYTVPQATGIVNRLYREITDIQYGRKEMKGWTRIIG